jgi:hypothetical protein
MRLYGAKYNNIELGFASFIIVVLEFCVKIDRVVSKN